MLTIDQALSKQVELLKRTVDITDAFEFVEVPVEVLRVLIEDHELLANMTAERDALKAQQENREDDAYTAGYDAGEEAASRDIKQLKAQIAAVPVQAIALYWEATYVDYGRLAPDDHMKVAKADEAVEEWIAEVKYGKREGWGGTPVTLEHPPDRSMEDADNDRFFGRG